jgi:hypothetical protein
MCRSPISAQINDDVTNHTLLVVMQDVCGHKVRVLAKYGMWGYSLEEATKRPEQIFDADVAAADAKLENVVLNTTDARRVRSAVGAGRRGAGAAAVVAAVAAALLLAV